MLLANGGSVDPKATAAVVVPPYTGNGIPAPVVAANGVYPTPVFCHNRSFPAFEASSETSAAPARKRSDLMPTRLASEPLVPNGPVGHASRGGKSKSRKSRRETEGLSATSVASEARAKVPAKAPSFDLEAAAFPPLPGAASAATAASPVPLDKQADPGNGCLADVVKGLSKHWKESCCINDAGDARDKSPDQSTSQSLLEAGPPAADQSPRHPVLKPTKETSSAIASSDSETDVEATSSSCDHGCWSGKTLSYCDVARKAKPQQDCSCGTPCPDALPLAGATSPSPSPSAATTSSATSANSEYRLRLQLR